MTTDRYEYTMNNGLLASKTANSKMNCHRCGQMIYEKDKFGPVNSHIYHKSCFKCFSCDTSLTLKSYKTSQAHINDKEVYCASHAPKAGGQMPSSRLATMPRTPSRENLIADTIVRSVDKLSPSSESSSMVRTLSRDNVFSTSSAASSTRTESEVSRMFAESKKWSSKENLLAMNSQTSRSDGKVATLTKKWNSRENLDVIGSPQISRKNSSQSNLLVSSSSRSGSRDDLRERSTGDVLVNIVNGDRRASEARRYEGRHVTADVLIDSVDRRGSAPVNEVIRYDTRKASADVIASPGMGYSRERSNDNSVSSNVSQVLIDASSRRGPAVTVNIEPKRYDGRNNTAEILTNDSGSRFEYSRQVSNDSGRNIMINSADRRGSEYVRMNSSEISSNGSRSTRERSIDSSSRNIPIETVDRRGSADARRYADGRKNSAEILSSSPKVEITFSPSAARKNVMVTTESSSATIHIARPKLIVDDLGGGINYNKYMDEIKRRQYNEPKRNITDLYLKSPKTTRKSGTGSTGNIFDEVSLEKSTKTGSKKKLNVQSEMIEELNFYESTCNYPSTAYYPDMHLSDNRLNNVSTSRRGSRCSSKHYDHEMMLADSEIKCDHTDHAHHGHHHLPEDQTRIHVNFKTGGTASTISARESSIPTIRTLSRDELSESSSTSRGVKTYNYASSNHGSRENLSTFDYHKSAQSTVPRSLGRVLISYVQRNNEFSVTIHRAEHLYKDKEDPLDSYVAMMLLPDASKQSTCITFVAENGIHPTWNEKFIYAISLATVKSKYIYLSIKDHKMASELLSTGLQYEALKLISLGEALIPLNDIQENVTYEIWCNLKEPSDVQDIILSKDL